MKNNNISNRQAPSLLFRLDDFIVEEKKQSLGKTLLDKIKGNYESYTLNTKITNVMYEIYRRTDMTIGAVVSDTEWRKYSKQLKGDIIDLPIKDIYVVARPFTIYEKLQSGEYLFYIDDNEDNRNQVGHHACITLEELNTLIKGR